MAKRPSLAETMRQVATDSQPAPVPVPLRAVPPPEATPESKASRPKAKTEPTATPKAFYAATRAGKKKVTATLSPAAHKQLKGLAVEHETTTEALLAEAITDLFGKYGKPASP
jgi:hypothetical protein